MMTEELTVEAVIDSISPRSRCRLPRYHALLALLFGLNWTTATTFTMLPVFLMPRLEAEWNLSHEAMAMIGSVFFAGSFVGMSAWGVLIDSYGRRKGVLLALLIAVVVGPLTAACKGPTALGCIRFFSGVSAGATVNSNVVLMLELAPSTHRMMLKSTITILSWPCWMPCLVGIAYAMREQPWQLLPLGAVWTTLPALLLSVRFVPESPRFLLGSGNEPAALAVLRSMAATNGASLLAATRLEAIIDASAAASTASSAGDATEERYGSSGDGS